jgi:hypothetical protein
MVLPRASRKLAGAGFILIGITVWAMAAVGPTAAQPRVAFLGVIFGGMLAMAGLALNFARRRRVRTRSISRRRKRMREDEGAPGGMQSPPGEPNPNNEWSSGWRCPVTPPR